MCYDIYTITHRPTLTVSCVLHYTELNRLILVLLLLIQKARDATANIKIKRHGTAVVMRGMKERVTARKLRQ